MKGYKSPNPYYCEELGRWYYSKDYTKRRNFHILNTLNRYHTGKGLSGKKVRTKEEYNQSNKKWQKENKEKFRQYQINYYKRKRQQNSSFRMLCNLRVRMAIGLKIDKAYKKNKMIELLGCSFNELKQHLESKFKEGMNWHNYGRKGWHIDHIIPCCAFDLTKVEEQKRCFHYTNLQPLWASENLNKIVFDKNFRKCS